MVARPVGGVGGPSRPAEVRVEARAHTRVEVSVRGDAGGLLVLGDPWYPQWRVEVDGRPAELLRVDHAFRGVRVPAGEHRVVFTYQDRALRAGLVVSALAVLGLAGLWDRRRRARLRAAEAAGPRPAGSP
jgi:uncharacterized membrane protein YfhO